MTKNNIHCIVINNEATDANKINPKLEGLFDHLQNKIFVETFVETINTNNASGLIKKLVKGNISILFIAHDSAEHSNDSHNKSIEHYKKLLRRYSIDTILISQSPYNSPLTQDLSGIENCTLSLEDSVNTPIYIKNLLRYAQQKKNFRLCKRLLSITDKRNRWLVNITQEPIAYIYKGTHIHANASYLSLFGFQSAAELKSSNIWDLIPKKNHNMFKKFIKKQRRQIDMQQTLLMSMKTIDKSKIRVGVRIASAVINKTQCLQVWIHKIEDTLTPALDTPKETAPVSPWENLRDKKTTHPNKQQAPSTNLINTSKATQASNVSIETASTPSGQSQTNIFNQLRQNLKTVKLNLQPLTDTNTSGINYYFAKLQFSALEQNYVKKQLSQSASLNSAMFWDYLLIIELTKKLYGNQQTNHQYLLSLSASSLKNNTFINFFIRALGKLSNQHPHIVLLLPHKFYKERKTRAENLKKILQQRNCSLGVYQFIPDKLSLQRVLKNKPSYLKFSSKWMQNLQGNEAQQRNLSLLTERLEQAGIQIILS